MKYLFCLLFLIIVGCNKSKVESGNDVTLENSEETKIPYKEFLMSINKKTEEEKKNYLFTFINYNVPNYWMVHLGHSTEHRENLRKVLSPADIL